MAKYNTVPLGQALNQNEGFCKQVSCGFTFILTVEKTFIVGQCLDDASDSQGFCGNDITSESIVLL